MTDQFLLNNLEAILSDAGKDEPSTTELALYKTYFQHVHKSNPSLVSRLSHWVQAQLVWDSRQEPLLQGMRSVGQTDYRLRYSTSYANVELAIGHEGRLRHLEGEILSPGDGTDSVLLFDAGPALIMLLRHGQVVAETTSDADGRFGFADLTADDYAMTLFLSEHSRIELVAVNVL